MSDSSNQSEENEDLECPEPSALAQEIKRLNSSVMKTLQTRERLPQPLFWSLFNDQLKSIKETKEKQRRISELL